MKRLRIDDVESIPVVGSLFWKPIRKTLGLTAFGINAYVADEAGQDVVEEHTEEQLGHEEVYVVMKGSATFTVDGETFDVDAGTLVYLNDVKQKRSAVAKEAGTTVLAIGGVPGVHAVSPWEYFFPAIAPMRANDWDTARRILEDALQETDAPVVHYQLACVEAQAGNTERAFAELETAVTAAERCRAWAREDDDFAPIRDDPRFSTLIG